MVGFSGAFAGFEAGIDGGVEEVFDLYDFESAIFTYGGSGLATSSVGLVSTTIKALSKTPCPVTAGANVYIGGVTGWSNSPKDPGIHNYSGPFESYSGGGTPPVIAPLIIGGQFFHSPNGQMWGMAASLGLGTDKLPFGASKFTNDYSAPFLKNEFHGRDSQGNPTPPTFMDIMRFQLQVSLALSSPFSQSFVSQISNIIYKNASIWNEQYRRKKDLRAP